MTRILALAAAICFGFAIRAALPHLGRTYPAGRPRPLDGAIKHLDDLIEGRTEH